MKNTTLLIMAAAIGFCFGGGIKQLESVETRDKWFGVTYKENKAAVVERFKKLIRDVVYKEELYSDL